MIDYSSDDIELKYYDIDLDSTFVNTSAEVKTLCTPRAGPEINERIGRKITMRKMEFRGKLVSEGADEAVGIGLASIALAARLIIAYDRSPNENINLPPVTDILETNSVYSFYNVSGADRFEILYDNTWVLDPYFRSFVAGDAMTCNVNQVKLVIFNLDLDHDVIFADTDGDFESISTGNLILFWIGDTSAPNIGSKVYWASRVWYSDD